MNRANPYRRCRNQAPFVTFGPPSILDLVSRVANSALRAAWYQKWVVHRRLRPEEFGGRVHNHLTKAVQYPLHREILDSSVLEEVFARNGSYLLPCAYSEGCPTHPAYPADHAATAGACATVLKIFFEESSLIKDPVEPSANGALLVPYAGPLTVGGEINKLASNIAIGRNLAGIHWRTDATEGLRLGEAVAIGVLSDMKECFNEGFEGFSFTTFDGVRMTL